MPGPADWPAERAELDPLAGVVAARFPDPALVIGAAGNVIWGNDAAVRLFGITVEQFDGQSILELIHPDDLHNAALAMSSVQSKEVGSLIDVRARCHDGWRLLEIRGAPIDSNLIISIRDLTGRHEWEIAGTDSARAHALLRYGALLALQLDRDGRVLSSSGAITRLLGHDQAVIDGQPFRDLVHPLDRARFDACLHVALSEPDRATGRRSECEVRLAGFDDTDVPHLLSLVNLLDDPNVGALVLSGQDISGRVEAEQELRRSHSLLVSTLEATNEGVVVIDQSGVITSHNQRFLSLWHLPPDVGHRRDALEIMDHILPQVLDPSHFLQRVAELTSDPHFEARDVLELRDGRVIERSTRPQQLGDSTVGRVFCFRDISEERRLRNELSHQAFHDSLTGLANQSLFRDRVAHALGRLGDEHPEVAVLFIDLDDFKKVNDSLGHAAGDELLAIAGQRLLKAVRDGDTVARLGGDEFAVLLDAPVSRSTARDVSERIIDVIRQPLLVSGTEVSCAASVGVVLGTRDQGVDDLLRNADLAMYAAKARGKSQHRMFAPEMHEQAVRRMELDGSLRRALRDQELVVYYQPVWILHDQSIEAVEALVRWQHPQRGLIGPGEFIPYAENSGLIDLIGEYVLAAACRDLAAWREELPTSPLPSMSVNLSTRQLLQRSLTARIAKVIARHDIHPSQLILEVTESGLMQDPDMAAQSLQQLHDLGIRLAVDDFGTGYSSLAYLQRFPIDFLKIDKTFIDPIGTVGEPSLVAAIVQLARTLNVIPVAEGVEEPEQLDALRTMGCDLAQGYLLGRPAPAEDILAMLRRAVDVPANAPT